MRVLFLPRYAELGASSRLRFYQYIPGLRERGIEVDVAPLFSDRYVRGLYGAGISKLDVARSYLERFFSVRDPSQYDVVFLEKELFPWLPERLELEALRGFPPLIVDYDDAVFHRYDRHKSGTVRALLGSKIDAVMGAAQLVTVGNDYLADRARAAGAKWIEHLPTVVDTTRYRPRTFSGTQPPTIGWIGTPGTADYLRIVSPALQDLARRRELVCVAVGARPDQLEGTPFVARPWSAETEGEAISRFDVGIMPLPDAPFERGKCGYKLIQYMASGIPVVASSVGINRTIVRPGQNGFLADDSGGWSRALELLLDNPGERQRLGAAGRADVETMYSLQSQLPRLEALFQKAAGRSVEREA